MIAASARILAGLVIGLGSLMAFDLNSITRADASPTNTTTVHFTVVFSNNAQDVDSADFVTAPTGTINVASLNVSGSNDTYTVTVIITGGDGTLGLALKSGHNITQQGSGTALSSDTPTGADESYDIDAPPRVMSVIRLGSSPTNSATPQFQVTFDSPVSGVDGTDFTASGSGLTFGSLSATPASGTVFTVDVPVTAGSGTLSLAAKTGAGHFADAAGNVLATDTPLGANETYTVDRVVPTVTSIVRVGSSPTGSSSVQFTVTFSEAVANVSGQVSASATGATTGTVVASSGTSPSATWTVTVTGCSGSGTIGLTVGTGTIADAAGNTLVSGTPSGSNETFTYDAVAPSVASVVLVSTSPTNGSSCAFTVTFGETVTGVGSADFAATTTGTLASGTINVTPVSGTIYTVTVTGITGDGILGLNTLAGGIADSAGNVLSSGLPTGSNQAYTVDRTKPVILSISRASTDPHGSSSLAWTVVFSEPLVAGTVDSADFALSGTASGGALSPVMGADSTIWTVTAASASGNGTLTLGASGGANITDLAGNVLASTAPIVSQSYTIDTTAARVVSVTRMDASPSNAASVRYQVVFDSAVSSVDGTKFTASGSGIVTGALTATPASGTSFTVTVPITSGQGTLSLAANTGQFPDAVGNTLSNATPTGDNETYAIDKVAPTVTSIIAGSASGGTLPFTLTFNEAVSAVPGQVTITSTGSASATTIVASSATVPSTTWTVTVSGASGSGTIGVAVGTGTIADAAGNALASGTPTGANQTFTIDSVNPTVSSIVRVGTSPTNATSCAFTVTFSRSVTGVDTSDFVATTTGTLSVGSLTVSGSGTTYTVTIPGISGEGTLGLTVLAGGISAGGNALLNGFPSGSNQTYAIDTVAPRVLSATRLDASPSNAASVRFQVVFDSTVSSVDGSKFTASGAGLTFGVLSATPSSGTTFTVTVPITAGQGTLGISANTGQFPDASGNTLATSTPTITNETYSIDRVVPTVTSVTTGAASNGNLPFTVTFSEPVSSVSGQVSAATTGTAAAAGIVASASATPSATWTVTVLGTSGNGTIGLTIATGTIVDAAGNLLASGTPTGSNQNFTIDAVLPTVTSVVRASASPTNATSLSFSVTFSESVTGVGAADFAATTTGTLAAGAISVTPLSSTVYTITVPTLTGDGVLGLTVLAGGIFDTASNALASGLPTGSNQTYVVDQTKPAITSIARNSATPHAAGTAAWTVTFSEDVLSVDNADFATSGSATVGAITVTPTASAKEWTMSVPASGDGSLALAASGAATIADAAGNSLSTAAPAVSESYTIDSTPPQVQTILREHANAYATSGPLDFLVVFSEPVTGVTGGDFTVATTGTAITGAVTAALVSGSTWRISVATPVSPGNGSVSISLNAGGVADLAGNASGTTAPSVIQSYTLDNTPPTVASVVRISSSPTSATTVDFRVTFSEPVSGVADPAFSAVRSSGLTSDDPTVLAATAPTDVWTIRISAISVVGGGSVGLSIAAGTIVDQAGLPLNVALPPVLNESYQIDLSAPILSVVSSLPVHYTFEGHPAGASVLPLDDPGRTIDAGYNALFLAGGSWFIHPDTAAVTTRLNGFDASPWFPLQYFADYTTISVVPTGDQLPPAPPVAMPLFLQTTLDNIGNSIFATHGASAVAGTIVVAVTRPSQLAVASGTISGDALDTISIGSPLSRSLGFADLAVDDGAKTIAYLGSLIGSFAYSSDGSQLTITVGGPDADIDVPVAAVEQIIDNLYLSNPSRNMSASTRRISVQVTNGDGKSSNTISKDSLILLYNDTVESPTQPIDTSPAQIVTIPGIPRTGSVSVNDVDSAFTFMVQGGPAASAGIQTTSTAIGTIVLDTTTGRFTYTANDGASGSDSFSIVVTDLGPNGNTWYGMPLIPATVVPYSVEVVDVLDASAPVIRSNAPMETASADTLTYALDIDPVVSGPSFDAALIGIDPSSFATGHQPALSISGSTVTLSWPDVPITSSGYYLFGILVVVRDGGGTPRATYQPVMLKVRTTPGGGT